MKIWLSLLSALHICTAIYAQDTAIGKPLPRQNEIGVRYDGNNGNATGMQHFFGVQYKHFGKKNIGYNLFAGLGNVGAFNILPSHTPPGSDTFLTKSTQTYVDMPIAGGGIEGQHRLYKCLYVFAAVEAKIGYGTGNTDTTCATTILNKGFPPSYVPYYTYGNLITGGGCENVRMLYYGLAASAGIKIRLKKVTAGFELPVVYEHVETFKGGTIYDNGSAVNIAVFASYRF